MGMFRRRNHSSFIAKNSPVGHRTQAPHINQQIDLPSIELLVETPERTTYQGRLKATDAADRTGPF